MKVSKLLKKLFPNRLAGVFAALGLAAAGLDCQAGLVGSYPVDANTLHLWHFDETSGSLAYDSVSNNPQTIPMVLSNTPGINAFASNTDAYFAAVDQPAVLAVYGNSISTTQFSCYYSPWIPSSPFNGNVYPSPLYTNICNYVNTNTGAFTFEVMLKPTTSLLSSTPVGNPEIFCSDNGGNIASPPVARGWQFRFDCGAPSAGQCELEFNDINCPGTNHQLIAHLPVTGPDAVALGNWYHVAVAYTGGAPTNGDPAHVLTMYWTLVDPSRTNVDVLTNFTEAFTYTNGNATGMLNWSPNTLTTGLYPSNSLHGTPFIVLGGSGRGSISNNVGGGGGFNGLMDEMRVSECYRHPNEMIFGTNVTPSGPAITGPSPTNVLVGYGQVLNLGTTVLGSTPMALQWYQNGVILPGQTNADLVINNVTFAANGNYQLTATNAYGGTNSAVCAVTVGAAFEGLFNTGVDANGNPLDQTAPGSVDLHWQLVTNPDPITPYPAAIVWGDGSPVQPNGVYPANGAAVWIGPETNSGGVLGEYVYQTRFQVDEAVVSSGTISGSLVAGGPPPSGVIQILLNGVETDITVPANNPFESAVSFVVSNGLQSGSNVLQFAMNNTTAGGGQIGLHVQLSGIGLALPPGLPTFLNQPTGITNQYGGPATLAAVAQGAPPLTYQWYLNGAALNPATVPGATNDSLTFSSANGDLPLPGSGNYQIVASNASGSITSSVVPLVITGIPVVTSTPADYTNVLTLYAGASPSFTVSASGSVPPYQYQWYSNNVALVNATNTTYQATNIPAGAWGTLNCVVTSTYGSSTGTVWTVNVLAAPTAPYPGSVLALNPMGYWRLNEPDDGLGDGNGGQIVHDYWNGNNGIYTNTVLGQPGYNSISDSSETSAEFGYDSFVNGMAYGIAGVDFSSPSNTSKAFTVEAWVNGYLQTSDAGIVGKGYNGGEQFDLDTGSDTVATHGFRFVVQDASGGTHAVSSSIVPSPGNWYHLVGVCDEVHSNVTFYINGQSAGSTSIAPGSGILTSTNLMAIGSRPSVQAASLTNNYNDQFVGWVNDVAVYNYALSAQQIQAEYYSAGIAPTITQEPMSSTNIDQGGTLVVPAAVNGTAPLAYAWFDQNASIYLPGQTNATLVISNIQASDSYYLTITNLYGSTNSSSISVNVYAGAPQISVNVPSQVYTFLGSTASIAVTAYGSLPLAYQWQVSDTNAVNWTNLVDNGRIIGSQSNVLTITHARLSDAGSYQVIITNQAGQAVSSVASLVVGTLPIGFNGSGLGWTAEQSGSFSSTEAANDVLTLTDGGGSESRSFFFQYPQYIGAFEASFTYQATGSAAADGTAFVLQNDPRGAAATGGGGGTLGYTGITPSVALELNLYTGNTQVRGYTVLADGLTGSGGANGNYKALGNVNIASGDPINVTVNYAQPNLFLTFTDAVAATSFTTNLNVGNLTNTVGSATAYVGFTGASGGSTAIQTISNFNFVSIPIQVLQVTATNTVVLSWSGAITGYGLQENSNLATTNWVNVTNPVTVVNGQNQVVVPVSGSSMFYQLNLQP